MSDEMSNTNISSDYFLLYIQIVLNLNILLFKSKNQGFYEA